MSDVTERLRPPSNLAPTDYVSTKIYTDQALFEEEQERLIRKTWKFACHISEIPKAGDYRTFEYGGYPLFVIHSDDGKIRCFINACSHRGSMVLNMPAGTAKSLVCPFHRWAFNTRGDCVAITREEGYHGSGISKENRGLREVRAETRLGCVFINLDDNGISFDEYIGDALEGFEETMGTVELEVFHYHRVIINANWKQWHETDMELYHEWAHVVNRKTSVAAKGYHDRLWKLYPNGHGTLQPFSVEYKNYTGWENRTEKPLPGLVPGEFRVVDLFPNTCFVARATSLRIDTSTPIAPGKTLIEYRGLGIKGESAEDREMRQRHHNQLWGPLGRNLAEDVMLVEWVEQACRNGAASHSIIARREDMKAQDDEVLRAYYREWEKHMGRPASAPFAVL